MSTLCTPTDESILRVNVAGPEDLQRIYRARHAVYALELAQHAPNPRQELTDSLDGHNVYLCVNRGDELAGFVSITPPGGAYSVDKYLSRQQIPVPFDDGLYEVRLLTVMPERRGRTVALLLMFAALSWIESRGGRRVIAIGRLEVLDLYRKLGLRSLGKQVACGAVQFELMSADVADLRRENAEVAELVRRAVGRVDWRLDAPATFAPSIKSADCFHGGAFFDAIGADFANLARRRNVINADVLDAWFPLAPGVLRALRGHLPWLARTSPPTDCGGLIDAIAAACGVDRDCILPGAGSSDLIFRGLRSWLSPQSRVLMLDPMYGEYAHVLERVIGCQVDRVTLRRDECYDVNLHELEARLRRGRYDLLILVNPNSPTGRFIDSAALATSLERVRGSVGRVWIDETYIDYVGAAHSLERFAAASANVFVCKSMSKVYALSGMRAAYLCGPAREIASLRAITPPWVIGLPAQVAAVEALRDPHYYTDRYRQTHVLRRSLQRSLDSLGLDVIDGCASFLLTHLPPDAPTAASLIRTCRARGVFLRDASGMGQNMSDRAVRFAVKGGAEQRIMIEAVDDALRHSAA
ncbi:hypothetical protein BH09PLA1_BH09PLA1_24840 [soil metagenome]